MLAYQSAAGKRQLQWSTCSYYLVQDGRFTNLNINHWCSGFWHRKVHNIMCRSCKVTLLPSSSCHSKSSWLLSIDQRATTNLNINYLRCSDLNVWRNCIFHRLPRWRLLPPSLLRFLCMKNVFYNISCFNFKNLFSHY
jgi:hypothetical protein